MEIDELPEEGLPEDSPLKRFLKKTYLILIAVFLILMFLANTNAGYHFISYMNGKVVTSTLSEDFSFGLKDGGKVIFDKGVFEELTELYLKTQKTEFKACITGEKSGEDYLATGMYVPETYKQELYSVSAELCDKNTIISLHSHPYLHCIFSNQDISNLEVYRRINPDIILGLMCDRDKITFYGY